ncbi:MAG: hypothetical protein ACLP2Y_13870 [Limisphaerales bacterium]
MGKLFTKRFRWHFCFGLTCVVLVTACISCGSLEQKRTEARIRHYFALDSREPLTGSVIESSLLARFPIGTPVNKLQTWLAGQGLGVDGHSTTWQTNQYVSYQVYDYSDAWFSMRHTQVTATFDDRQKIQKIQAQVYSYGL